MKMCIQAVLDGAGALRHMNKNNSERPVCTTHPLAPISTSFLFVFDTEWVMSTCEHQGRDTVLHTCLKLHWSRHSASSCFNRVWNVTISSAKHQSMLRPWVMQHQPWHSPSAWTKTRSLHGCRNFYLLILPSPLSLSLSLSLFFSLFLTGPTSVALSCVSSRLNFAPKSTCRAKKKKNTYCAFCFFPFSNTPRVVTVTPPLFNRHCRAYMPDCTLAGPP